ncbi:XRE family transcriptional regulator [Shewanella xiamenensis]|uniref:XRE family transcriptional regulator n=1 Tax=Shewanella xiamenensis TaxID=332186 RepID=A0ABT6UGQ2_9GAMM|nr:XRE family transcriptional regulator [Shewanella xiamenensis]MDI5833649.1 XRE family transcriptional regulator [Shewanella xiamenensis]
MFGRLTIRNLKTEILDKLNELASVNERSVEGEVRYALAKWTESGHVDARVDELYREKISKRLMILMQQKNELKNSSLKASHVAERMGLERGSVVEKWIVGEVEPTFEELNKLADYFSANPLWLKHGDGMPFDKIFTHIPEQPQEAIEWLLKKERYDVLKKIVFIRCSSGGIYLVKVYDNEQSIVYYTPYVLDDSVGSGGFNSMIKLFIFWEELYKQYTKQSDSSSLNNTNIIIQSYLFNESDSKEFSEGNTDPLVILKKQEINKPWWEDVWESDEDKLREYWPGCKEWCALVNRHKVKKQSAVIL